jgi:hypothetical protein
LRIFEKLAPLLLATLKGASGAVQAFFFIGSTQEITMLNRSLSLALIGSLLLMVISVPPAVAQSKAENEAAHTAKVKAAIAKLGTGPDAKIKVKLRDKTKLSGYVSQANDDAFVITNPKTGASSTVPYLEVAQAQGENLPLGAKIAITAGIVAGAFLLMMFLIYAIASS